MRNYLIVVFITVIVDDISEGGINSFNSLKYLINIFNI